MLWEISSRDELGEPTLDAAIEIKVRWVSKKSEALDPQGNTIAIDATVVTVRNIPIGSIMWKGGLDDLAGTSVTPDDDLMQVVTNNETPDLKARATRRTVGLIRFRDALPDLA